MRDAVKQICFVDMPFGKKVEPKSGMEVDFDQIFDVGIEPAITAAGLVAIRGDREETGGIIHTAMFARLLLAEFVIADMTTANPNVFYELGVRHAAKPYTTIPIFATLGAPPFDVNMVRAIPYELEDGILGEAAAAALICEIGRRIERALSGPISKDSPLFDLFPDFPGIEMSHELTDVFRDRVEYSDRVKDALAVAREKRPREAATQAIREIARSLGDPKRLERGVLIDIFLSYRAVEAFDDMITVYEQMSADVQATALVRQQLALALNRRNSPGDRDRAVRELKKLIHEQGDSAETLGILGRIYKDRYREAKTSENPAASGYLDLAIEAYTRGFEAEPADYYPGVNAITLLLQRGDKEAQSEVDRLVPLVTFAAVRRGGEKAEDYWTVATVLELACVGRDYGLAQRCLARALSLAKEGWMFKTTADNLRLLLTLREGEEGMEQVSRIVQALENAAAE
ncbi:MAG: TRAFs-binding domain-containing protein [Chromatiales bacterium]|jgi:tetratricopeptide (TPR) repeat protein